MGRRCWPTRASLFQNPNNHRNPLFRFSLTLQFSALLFSTPVLVNNPMSNHMMLRILKTLLLPVLLLAPLTLRAADPPASPRAYDLLYKAYGPYVDAADPLAFPAKVRALSVDRYAFWRGAKDLFFLWCKNNTQNWMAEKETYVRQEGDQHLGNVGTYMSGRNFGSMAFGMVDFDDSHSLPFQFELLQGIITLRLTAEERQVSLDNDQLDQLI